MSKETLLKDCNNLESSLTDYDLVDINGVELTEEIFAVSVLLNKKESLSHVLKLIEEKSLYKLELFINFLRSTTTQRRLNGLVILAI